MPNKSLMTLFRRAIKLVSFVSLSIFNYASFALEGGSATNAANYPGMVILSYGSVPNSIFAFQNCSGIVLEPTKILTSASCVQYNDFNNGGATAQVPANQIYVHPVPNGETVGTIGIPIVKPTNTPNVSATSYAIHPLNTFVSGPYNLAILTLATSIGIDPTYIYNGSNKFIGQSTTALGWKEETRTSFPFYNNYRLNKLSFSIIDGSTNINDITNGCYDSFNYTGTVFCGGFRNGISFLDGQDEGAPIYKSINGQQTVIGILADASHGILFDEGYTYEEFARVSTMNNFIKQNAPNTQFFNESSVPPQSNSIHLIPIIQLLLLDE